MWRTKSFGSITALLRPDVAALEPLIISAEATRPVSTAEPATARAIVIRFITFPSVQKWFRCSGCQRKLNER
jgi:hypothetical protein